MTDYGVNSSEKEPQVKYLCLVYAQEDRLHDLPESPRDSECHAYASSLAERGRLVAGQALESVSTATTVRVRDGEAMVTDGPFAETAEQLTGFYLIEARDLNDAIRIAEGIPPARIGSIEIRPVRELQLDQESAA